MTTGSLTLEQYYNFDVPTRSAVFEWLSPEDQATVKARRAQLVATPQNQALAISAPISVPISVPISAPISVSVSAGAQVSTAVSRQIEPPKWETPSHREVDGFDWDLDLADPLPLVPAELKAKPNWVRWKLETVNGRLTKVPYQLNGNKASSTDPATWNTYDIIVAGAVIDETQGIGIMTDSSFVGFDFDGCRSPQTGEITKWAQEVIDLLRYSGAYVEITPSGYGVRAYAFGSLPDGTRRFSVAVSAGFGEKVGIEVYNQARYFTVTGNRLSATSEMHPDISAQIYGAYVFCGEISKKFPSEKRKAAVSDTSGSNGSVQIEPGPAMVFISKLALLMYGEIVSRSPFVVQDEHGNKLTYPSQSEADMSLATVLAIKHGDNPELIDSDFRESSLYRPKWEREDYRNGTIQKAIKTALETAKSETSGTAKQTETQAVPIVDDPSDDDPRFEMKGDFFDTKVYEDASHRETEYPDPGEHDLISRLAKKLTTGTPIPLAYAREPLKAIVLHAIDGKVIHPAHRKMTMRGNYFSLGESEGGKTTGLEYALQAASLIFSTCQIHPENLFRYKSEQTFIRSFTPEGTIKRDPQGNIKSGHSGHSSQFLYIKEGNLVANSSDYFAAVFSMLTNLYDQTEAGTESMTNGDFTARVVKASTVMCFTPTDFKATFGGKGNIDGGGLNRWGIINPPEDHFYDDKDWKPLSDAEIQEAIAPLATRVFELKQGDLIVLTEEAGAVKIRLETKAMLKKAGKAGKRLLEYFMREQVAQAVLAVDGQLIMTTEQARYAKQWVIAQMECRLNCWPSDANNQIEGMEHIIRKAVTTHHVSEKKLKDVCHLYREGSGGWFVYKSAVKNMMDSGAIKWTGKTRKGTKTYCPGSCAAHPPVEEEKPRKSKE